MFNAFLKIGRDGRVIVAVPQAEAGQGVYTTLPQIVADELGADWRTVAVEPAPLSPLYANVLLAEEAAAGSAFPEPFGRRSLGGAAICERNAVMLTGGSSSVRGFEARLREAGAGGAGAAHAWRRRRGGARTGRSWTRATGFVVRGSDRLAFAELAAEAAALDLPARCRCAAATRTGWSGSRCPGSTCRPRSTAAAMFAGDVRLRDMCLSSRCARRRRAGALDGGRLGRRRTRCRARSG